MVIRSRTFRRALALVAALTLVALWFPKLLPGANAVGTFQDYDGNLTATAGANDWSGIPAAELGKHFFTATDRPSGNTDDDMGGGSKNSSTVVHLTQGTIPDNKADLKRAYLYAQGQFLYLAWIRGQSSGDVHIDFEINQDPQNWPNATKAFQDAPVAREAKDVLISYDWPGSGPPDISARQWTGSA